MKNIKAGLYILLLAVTLSPQRLKAARQHFIKSLSGKTTTAWSEKSTTVQDMIDQYLKQNTIAPDEEIIIIGSGKPLPKESLFRDLGGNIQTQTLHAVIKKEPIMQLAKALNELDQSN